MANIKFIATNHNKLSSINIKDGQIIFVKDEKTIYLDSEGARVAFENILTIDSENNREQTVAIEGCFYYVEDSKLIYRYKNAQWNCLNSSEIVFDDKDSFPKTGDEKKIYISDNNIYKWNKENNEYIKIGCGNIMNELYWGSMK